MSRMPDGLQGNWRAGALFYVLDKTRLPQLRHDQVFRRNGGEVAGIPPPNDGGAS